MAWAIVLAWGSACWPALRLVLLVLGALCSIRTHYYYNTAPPSTTTTTTDTLLKLSIRSKTPSNLQWA
jgi:hypothetical protein